MRREVFGTGLALSLVGWLAAGAAADQFAIWRPGDGGLSVVGGEVRWTKVAHDDLWFIDETKQGYTIRVAGGKWDQWYLTCDPDGKGKALFLSEKAKPGSYWKVNGLSGGETVPSRPPRAG
jgi:hypothetical protein